MNLVENSPKGPKTEQTKSKQREERDGVIMLSSSGQKSKRIKSERHEFFFLENENERLKKNVSGRFLRFALCIEFLSLRNVFVCAFEK